MIKLFLLCVLFFAFDVNAADESSSVSFGGFFSHVSLFFDDLNWFFFTYIPSLLDRLRVWVIYYLFYAYIYLKIKAVEISFSVASLLLSDLGLVSLMTSFANSLPADIKHFAVQCNVFKGINLVLETLVAKFVYNFVGGK